LPHQPEEMGYDPYSMPDDFRRDNSPDSLYSTNRFNAMSTFEANEVIRLETKSILSEIDDLLATAATASSFWPGSRGSKNVMSESLQLNMRGAEYLLEVGDLIAQADDMFADRFALSPVEGSLVVQAKQGANDQAAASDALAEAKRLLAESREFQERWKPAALDMKLIVGEACRRSELGARQHERGGLPPGTLQEASHTSDEASLQQQRGRTTSQGMLGRSRPPVLNMHVIVGEPPSPSPRTQGTRTEGRRGGGSRWRSTFAAAVGLVEAKEKMAPLLCQVAKKPLWSWAPWGRPAVMA